MAISNLRLRNQFLILFILTGLLPVIAITFLVVQQSTSSLLEKSFNQLDIVQDIRKSQTEKNFSERFDDIEFISNSFALEDKDLLANYLDNSEYNDLYVIDGPSGIITFRGTGGTGAAIESEEFQNTSLNQIYQKAKKSHELVIEDFSVYENKYNAFTAKGIFNENGDCKAVIILQYDSNFISSILDSRKGMGESGESYLISWDESRNRFEFRSTLKTIPDISFGEHWRVPLPYWISAIEAGEAGGHGLYIDSQGNDVLVSHNRLHIQGLNWYLISKIDHFEVTEPIRILLIQTLIISIIFIVLIVIVSLFVTKAISKPISLAVDFAEAVSVGNLNMHISLNRNDEIGRLVNSLNNMGRKLESHNWYHEGKTRLDNELRGEHSSEKLYQLYLNHIVAHTNSMYGAVYTLQIDNSLLLSYTNGFSDPDSIYREFKIGEGMVGECARKKEIILFDTGDLPSFNIGFTSIKPHTVCSIPVIFENNILSVVLLGTVHLYSDDYKEYLHETAENLGVLLNVSQSGEQIKTLLEESQIQQEELKSGNEELEAQTKALKESESRLQIQQEELRIVNEELEERTQTLELQKKDIKQKNNELHYAQAELEEKARDLEQASQYKSEFLANMSHELRTPLNSILILSQLLGDNKDLDTKHIKSAKAIYESGSDLLKLINEILDLSKIESGKMNLEIREISIKSICASLKRTYEAISEKNKTQFTIVINEQSPEKIITDSHRLLQVLKNLLTNAFKFTHKGMVQLLINCNNDIITFAVKDNGIGIPEEKQHDIFKAFHQADGSTSRKYGGTGLGLSISREIISLLNGTISLKSEVGKGSVFTVELPLQHSDKIEIKEIEMTPPVAPGLIESTSIHNTENNDIENIIQPKSRKQGTILIIEDDPSFSQIIGTAVQDEGYDVLYANSGEQGLYLADFHKPVGVMLDIGLPGIDGYEVLRRLKEDPVLKDIPVHIISGADLDAEKYEDVSSNKKPVQFLAIKNAIKELSETKIQVLNKETSSFLKKLESPDYIQFKDSALANKTVLLVDDDIRNIFALSAVLEEKNINVITAKDGLDAIEKIKEIQELDGILMDIMMPRMDGYEAIKNIRQSSRFVDVPIIALTAKALSEDKNKCLAVGANDYLAKPINTDKLLSMLRVWLY